MSKTTTANTPGDSLTIDHATAATAVVTPASAVADAPVLTALYHSDGRALFVPEDQADVWIREGFSRERHDISELSTQTALLFDSAKGAVAAYADEASKNAVLTKGDTSNMYVAEHAMADLTETWGRLHRAIHAQKGVAQGEAVEVTHYESGEAVSVDPTQRDFYATGPSTDDTFSHPRNPYQAPSEVTQSYIKAQLATGRDPMEQHPATLAAQGASLGAAQEGEGDKS